jgi:hypothetical protein
MDFSETLPNSMFSRPMFSDLSMEPQASEDVAIYDIVSFLALAQQCGLDLLPIKWQPALGVLGKGGTAAVNQSLINVQMSYAFKRVLPLRAVKSGFREWASELLILCHSWMRTNYHIARLEAFCLEVLKDGRVSPVLIFEKAELGDLEHFVTLEEANAISFDGWLKLCLGLGGTLHNMQWFGKQYCRCDCTKMAMTDMIKESFTVISSRQMCSCSEMVVAGSRSRLLTSASL